MLTLRKATPDGEHSVCYFRDDARVVDRVVISRPDYDAIRTDADPDGEYRTESGVSVRPRTRARLYKATTETKYDTPDGFLSPGDYSVQDNGELFIQLEHSDATRIVLMALDDSEYTGDPNRPNTLNADITVLDDNRVSRRMQIIAGVLQ